MRIEDYPLAITVEQVAEIMGISRGKAYDMTHRKDFPAIRDGNRIIIPRDAFYRWFTVGVFETGSNHERQSSA